MRKMWQRRGDYGTYTRKSGHIQWMYPDDVPMEIDGVEYIIRICYPELMPCVAYKTPEEPRNIWVSTDDYGAFRYAGSLPINQVTDSAVSDVVRSWVARGYK